MAVNLIFEEAVADATNATEYTFSAVDIGVAAGNRSVIVVINSRGLGTTRTVSSATIGGIGATISVQGTNIAGGNSSISAVIVASVPTGTTADVVVTFDAEMLRCGIGSFSTTGIDNTATDSFVSTSDGDPTGTIDVVAGGFAVGGAYSQEASPSASWTGLTERYDASLDSVTHTGGSADFATTQTGLTVTVDFTSPANNAGAFAAFQEGEVSAFTPKVMMF